MWLEEALWAPDFPRGNAWLNSEPLSLGQHRGDWLIAFWDYTDLACVRALPYVVEWHRRYAGEGLRVVGIHSPRFRFARQRHLVERAVQEFGVEFPVVLDNHHSLWRAYGNDCWPTFYLIDPQRQIRYLHLGEGRYDEAETAIHLLLREMNPSVDLPPIMRPLRYDDEPGRPRSLATPDLYTGYERGRFGDPDGYVYDHTVMYEDCGERDEGVLYAHGQWHTSSDYMAFMGESGYLAFTYRAAGVTAVLAPTWDEMALMLQLQQQPAPRVGIWLDRGPVPAAEAGADVVYDRSQGSFVVVDRPRPFNLTRHPRPAHHELRLTFSRRDVTAYAFAFLAGLDISY